MAGSRERFSFDEQAGAFERRTGVPSAVAEATARALSRALLPGPSDLLLDVGAGSGGLGQHLAEVAPRYVGLDLSLPMLGAFRDKLRGAPIPLVQADASSSWPIVPGSVRAMLFSRSAHLMDTRQLLREIWRAARLDGAWVVIARVERDPGSMRSILRERMRELLAERLASDADVRRRGGGAGRRLARVLADQGARVQPARCGGSWWVEDRLDGVLDDWRSKPGLGGRDVDRSVKREVLDALEAWGGARFGTLQDRAERSERRFEWTPIRLPDPLPPLDTDRHVQSPTQ